MKKKVLLSSILTIALCVCLIAGSTFALFTHTSEVSIVATAGNVEMQANIAILKLESVLPNANGTVVDEFGGTYEWDYVDTTDPYEFKNGGTAVITGSELTLTHITPGDRVTFGISGTNTSNVDVLYRYTIKCEKGENLMKGLVFNVASTGAISYMETYTSAWTGLEVGEDMEEVAISVELPVTAGNIFENEETTIQIIVEAYQGNAAVSTDPNPVITYYNTVASAGDMAGLLADPYLPVIDITEDMAVTVANVSNKTINANNNDVDFVVSGTLDNVTITGIKEATPDDEASIIVESGTNGTLIVKDCEAIGTQNANKKYGAIAGAGAPDLSLIVDNCNFVTYSGNKTGIYFTTLGSLTVTNSTFTGFSSWAINDNGKLLGNLVVDNCTFTGCTGVMKVLSGVAGEFTFTNNEIVDCNQKNNYYVDVTAKEALTTIDANEFNFAGTVTEATKDGLLGIKWAQ